MSTVTSIHLGYTFPLSKFLIISLAVIRVVWYMVGTSRVEVKLSANPNGSMSGIQPCHQLPAHALPPRGAPQLTSSILHSPCLGGHTVLLDHSALHVVDISRVVDFSSQVTSFVRCLLTLKNVKVVIGRMSARVAFRADRRTEDDQVLGDRGVQDEHGPHSSSGIVEHPFTAVLEIRSEARLRVVRDQVVNEGLDEDSGVLRGAGLGCLSGRESVLDRLV